MTYEQMRHLIARHFWSARKDVIYGRQSLVTFRAMYGGFVNGVLSSYAHAMDGPYQQTNPTFSQSIRICDYLCTRQARRLNSGK